MDPPNPQDPALVKVPVYRFYRPKTGEHLFTLDFAEGVNAGYRAEFAGFKLLAPSAGVAPSSKLVALYRCMTPASHFVSTDPQCEGSTPEGLLGYAYRAPTAGTLPVYRFYQPQTGDHLFSQNPDEGKSRGYINEAPLGYLPPLPTLIAHPRCDGISDDTNVIQDAINQSVGGSLLIPAAERPCLVSTLHIPGDVHVTIDATIQMKKDSNDVNGSTNSLLWIYDASNIMIDGRGTLDANRANQSGACCSAGISAYYAKALLIQGLTVRNAKNFPVNIVLSDGAAMQDLTLLDSGNSAEFAGETRNCAADGLRVDHIDDAGFAFYGGVEKCAIRNSVLTGSWFGLVVLNDNGQAQPVRNILIENVEGFGNTPATAFSVITNLTADFDRSKLSNCIDSACHNYDVTIRNSRSHANSAPWSSDGLRVTVSNIDTSGGATTQSVIRGNVDGIFANGDGSYTLRGWACALYDPNSIQVALYVGEGASATGVAWFPADQFSEPAVASVCASGGAAHRFSIPLSKEFAQQHSGQALQLYGISPWSLGNLPLQGSGSFRIP